MRKPLFLMIIACLFLSFARSISSSLPQNPASSVDLDAQVRKFLDSRRGTWHDLNVPEADGQKLHDTILEHKYKSALEIGTSTGHSGIWIAWALAKTGGKLVTVEIDKDRHDSLANPLLAKHHRPAGIQSDRQGDERHQRRSQDYSKGGHPSQIEWKKKTPG